MCVAPKVQQVAAVSSLSFLACPSLLLLYRREGEREKKLSFGDRKSFAKGEKRGGLDKRGLFSSGGESLVASSRSLFLALQGYTM